MSSTLVENPRTVVPESDPGDASCADSVRGGMLKSHMTLAATVALMGTALFGSGAAGLINQVVWQRSLKVFLGGSETICSTVVVLVFMGGLGVGSWWSGKRAGPLRNPLKTFATLEALLGCINVGVWLVLTADVSDSVFAMQRLAMGAGIPLLMMYAIGATLVLAIPCLLMGATIPLAAQVCQSNLGLRQPRLLAWLFFINTAGSVLGAVVSSGSMIPQLGLSASMVIAATLDVLAGAVLLVLCAFRNNKAASVPKPVAASAPLTDGRISTPGTADLLAMGLGFCSLG